MGARAAFFGQGHATQTLPPPPQSLPQATGINNAVTGNKPIYPGDTIAIYGYRLGYPGKATVVLRSRLTGQSTTLDGQTVYDQGAYHQINVALPSGVGPGGWGAVVHTAAGASSNAGGVVFAVTPAPVVTQPPAPQMAEVNQWHRPSRLRHPHAAHHRRVVWQEHKAGKRRIALRHGPPRPGHRRVIRRHPSLEQQRLAHAL
jgi:hypothetical protein